MLPEHAYKTIYNTIGYMIKIGFNRKRILVVSYIAVISTLVKNYNLVKCIPKQNLN